MEYVSKFIAFIFNLMKIEFNLYGYNLSFFKIFVFTCLASILACMIGGIFSD